MYALYQVSVRQATISLSLLLAHISRCKPWESLWGSLATTPLVDFHHRLTACPSYYKKAVPFWHCSLIPAQLLCTFKTTYKKSIHLPAFLNLPWLCPRPISNSQLHVLPHFHLCPIYLVVFKGSYYLSVWEILSLGGLHA